MSYFLCLSVPQKVANQLPSAFDKSIRLTDASTLPIGKAAQGKNRSWVSTLLQIGSSSASLIGKGAVRKTRNNDHTELFISGVQVLLKSENCSCLSFLVHWMKGYISTEEVALQEEKQIVITDLLQVISALEEDVRYIVSS